MELLLDGQPKFGDLTAAETPKFNMEERPFETADRAALRQLAEAAPAK